MPKNRLENPKSFGIPKETEPDVKHFVFEAVNEEEIDVLRKDADLLRQETEAFRILISPNSYVYKPSEPLPIWLKEGLKTNQIVMGSGDYGGVGDIFSGSEKGDFDVRADAPNNISWKIVATFETTLGEGYFAKRVKEK